MARYLKEDGACGKILARRIPDYFEEWSMNFEMFIVDIKNYESIKGCRTNSYQNVNSVVIFSLYNLHLAFRNMKILLINKYLSPPPWG